MHLLANVEVYHQLPNFEDLSFQLENLWLQDVSLTAGTFYWTEKYPYICWLQYSICLKLYPILHNQIWCPTFASENIFLSKGPPGCCITGVPISSSFLKHELLKPSKSSVELTIVLKPAGQSSGAAEQKNGFPRAHKELFHLYLLQKYQINLWMRKKNSIYKNGKFNYLRFRK